MHLRPASILLCSLLAACGGEKKSDNPPAAKPTGDACGPLTVTIDGKPVDGLTHAFALTQQSGDDTNEQVHVFNHDKVTCADLLGAGRAVADGEIWVRASVGKKITTRGIGFNEHAELDVDVKQTSAAATKPGDQVSLCVPRTELAPAKGAYAGKKVVVSGTMSAAWCGTQTL
ncbi:MAG: hypothetical protein JNK64_23530 [Myxococcales bacterium]|nr:hypothetical protein [Myxococcales bacterium]